MEPKFEMTVLTLTTVTTLARMIAIEAVDDQGVTDHITGTPSDQTAIECALDGYCAAALQNHLGNK